VHKRNVALVCAEVVAVALLWLAITIAFEWYLHEHPTRAWEAAITATSTIFLVGVTAIYVALTMRLARSQVELVRSRIDPLTAYRIGAQEAAMRELAALLNADDRIEALDRAMPFESEHRLIVDLDELERAGDGVRALEVDLRQRAPLLPERFGRYCTVAYLGLRPAIDKARELCHVLRLFAATDQGARLPWQFDEVHQWVDTDGLYYSGYLWEEMNDRSALDDARERLVELRELVTDGVRADVPT